MKITQTKTVNGVLCTEVVLKLILTTFKDIDSTKEGLIAKDYVISVRDKNNMDIAHTPIFISETEPIKVGDKCINLESINEKDNIIYVATTTALWKDSRKIIALSENFSPEQLRVIQHYGLVIDGKKYWLECEEKIKAFGSWCELKLTKDNHVIIVNEQSKVKCADCDIMIPKDYPFTVCDTCWDKVHGEKEKQKSMYSIYPAKAYDSFMEYGNITLRNEDVNMFVELILKKSKLCKILIQVNYEIGKTKLTNQ